MVAAAFAAVTTTISVAADLGEGVIDRLRTLPMAKSAVITGHVIADLARSLVGFAVAIAAGYAVGFRPAAGAAGWAAVAAATMPSWLRVVTANQPVTQAVDTLRALLLNKPLGSHLWLTLTEFGAIIVAAFTLAAVLFKRTASA